MNITVIGAGVFGAWCAWFLSERGHRVTLIDQYGPANARASSADHSRVIRCGYGADEIYSRWALASFEDWRALEARSGRALVVPSGALFLGAPDDQYIRATHATLTGIAIDVELLDPPAWGRRFTQIAQEGLGAAVYEPGAGVIRARLAVQTLVQSMIDEDRAFYRLARVNPADLRADEPITLSTGEPVAADAFVFACGPWLPSLFPRTVGACIRSTRQEVLHFGVPPGDDRFSLARMPVWIDFSAGLYGIPDLDGRGFKVGIDRHGPSIDPDTHDRELRPDVIARTRAWLAQRFPGLRSAPLLDAHVCQYENTDSGHFLIDRHPSRPDVWVVGGGSGHGFKHGPAVGRYLTAVISGEMEPIARFTLSGRKTIAARAVY